jgi:hypothetical protein
MAMHPVIDDLDRCKSALQYIAEGQSTSLTVVLELLLEQLEDAIGQAEAQLRQCTCQGAARPRGVSSAASRGVLTLRPRSRQRHPRLGPPKPPRRSLCNPAPQALPSVPRENVQTRGRQPGGPWSLLHASHPSPARGHVWTPHMLRDTCTVLQLKRGRGA